MAKRTTGKVPDAWEDDDWEVQADKAAAVEEEEPEPQQQPQLSRAERLAQHAESNRKLWESAYVFCHFTAFLSLIVGPS